MLLEKNTEGADDPTIFFAYVKSLYENYVSLGQYDKALNVLKQLYDMDPENEAYLIDMGNIYLYGYNDAKKKFQPNGDAFSVSTNELTKEVCSLNYTVNECERLGTTKTCKGCKYVQKPIVSDPSKGH